MKAKRRSVSDVFRKGRIAKKEEIGIGITDPQHWFFKNTIIEACAKTGYIEGEVASYLISNHFGGTVIPETMYRTIGKTKYSLQKWIKKAQMGKQSDKHGTAQCSKRYKEMRLWDFLFGNSDRHDSNWIVVGNGKVWAIDNGFTFGGGWSRALYFEDVKELCEEIEEAIDSMSKRFIDRFNKIASTPIVELIKISEDNINEEKAKILKERARMVRKYSERKAIK